MDLRATIPGLFLVKRGYSKVTDGQTNSIIKSVIKICFLLYCSLFGCMNPAQNLRQERVFLAISDTRQSERQFAGVLMHHVILSVFFRRKRGGNTY